MSVEPPCGFDRGSIDLLRGPQLCSGIGRLFLASALISMACQQDADPIMWLNVAQLSPLREIAELWESIARSYQRGANRTLGVRFLIDRRKPYRCRPIVSTSCFRRDRSRWWGQARATRRRVVRC